MPSLSSDLDSVLITKDSGNRYLIYNKNDFICGTAYFSDLDCILTIKMSPDSGILRRDILLCFAETFYPRFLGFDEEYTKGIEERLPLENLNYTFLGKDTCKLWFCRSDLRLNFKGHEKDRIGNYIMDPENSSFLGLSVVELSISDVCNRSCVFCPRGVPGSYSPSNKFMEFSTVEKIIRELDDKDYKGEIHLCGFGEPIYHPKLMEIITLISNLLPESYLELTTNGDSLIEDTLGDLVSSGLSKLVVNCYDSLSQIVGRDSFLKSVEGLNYKIRHHVIDCSLSLGDNMDNFGFTNRGGSVKGQDLSVPLDKECFYPFYKMTVDWSGEVVLCCNDWGKEFGPNLNLVHASVEDIWSSGEFTDIRIKLSEKDRSSSPCNKCNVDGTLVGKGSFEAIVSSWKI